MGSQEFFTIEWDKYLANINSAPPSPLPLPRVLGTVANSVEFSTAFQCGAEQAMNPRKKCKVWWRPDGHNGNKVVFVSWSQHLPRNLVFINYQKHVFNYLYSWFQVKSWQARSSYHIGARGKKVNTQALVCAPKPICVFVCTCSQTHMCACMLACLCSLTCLCTCLCSQNGLGNFWTF